MKTSIFPVAAFFCLYLLVSAGEASPPSKTLKGLRSVAVLVTSDGCEQTDLNNDTIKTEVELRLRQTGLRLENSSLANLYVEVSCYQAPGIGVAFHAEAYLFQVVAWGNPPESVRVGTWFSRAMIGLAQNRELETRIKYSTQVQVSEFLNAYLAANQ
jgi:hypothetical protein